MLDNSRDYFVFTAAIFFANTCLASPPQGYPANPGWDMDDPVNIQEAREYFSDLYEALDLDVPFDHYEFTFTNPRPEMDFLLLAPAYELFSALYADQIDSFGLELYSITDLINDNPVVAAQFQEYVTTGNLSTDFVVQPIAAINHLILATDASDCYERIGLNSFTIADTKVKSTELVVKACIDTDTDPDTEPDGPDPFECDLDIFVQRSLFECMTDEGLYLCDDETNCLGRFDCEDFATSMALWLLEQHRDEYPDMEVLIICVYWSCQVESYGHAMPVVIIDGKYYLVDPYTGEFYGSYDSIHDAMSKAYDLYAPSICDDGSTPTPGTPNHYFPPNQPPIWSPPWWEYLDMQQRFCENLTACCIDSELLVAPSSLDCPNPSPSDLPQGCNICDYVPAGVWISPGECGGPCD